MNPSTDRLQETLGRPELARLRQRLRRRLEQGRPLTGSLTLGNLTPAERDACNRLLGRTSAGGSLSIDLDLLERRFIEAGLCESLAHAVQLLGGPVIDRAEARRREAAQWESLFNDTLAAVRSRPELVSWLEQLRSQGLLRRYGIGPAQTLLGQALAVAARLPADGVPLAELAATTVGDAHALDGRQPLGTLVIRLAAPLGGVHRWDDAASRREAWASLGVLLDDLSAPVLVLNLRASGSHHVSRVLDACADAGEPCHLTLRQLRRSPPRFVPEMTGPSVFVCENPNVVAAAADRLGSECAPLVCTEGQPRTALHVLLRQLTDAGIQLHYHGDFDWPGIQMANAMISRHGARPWRLGAADYRAAAIGEFTLSGAPVHALWDPDLHAAMLERGKAVHEEQVADSLLADLHFVALDDDS